MSVEVVIWFVVNAVSFYLSSRDLTVTAKVWAWARRNVTGEMRRVAQRNFRAALMRFLLALTFILTGVITLIPAIRTWWVWMLVLGATLLAIDIALETHYRGDMFRAAQTQAKKAKSDSGPRQIKWPSSKQDDD